MEKASVLIPFWESFLAFAVLQNINESHADFR